MADVTDPRDPDRYAYLAHGNATQARKRVAADLLIRDKAGRVLLVDPTYKPDWDLPGGMAEANESPRTTAAREVREELNLQISPGRLLLVDWIGPKDPWDDQLVFVFDGGTLDHPASITITDPEIAGYQFATIQDAGALLRPDVQRRLVNAHQALDSGTTSYDELQRSW